MARIEQDGAVKATLAGIVDRLTGRGPGLPLSAADRLDGKTAVVTGANRGLGEAIAVDLARRGARVLVACRSGLPDAARAIARASGGDVVGERLDLADFDDVVAFCHRLRARGERLDVTVLNAGLVPARARATKQGFEEMFAVNYLANVLLVRRLLADGTIPNAGAGNANAPGDERPRIVFVSSESHRSAPRVDPATLGRFEDYDMRGSVAAYGKSKLLLETFAAELARRLTRDGDVDVAVHSLCPGAVRTGIAREAPWWAKPLLAPAMYVFFRPPDAAAVPVVYLAASRAVEGRTGVYLHVAVEKPPADAALDPELGRQLWDASAALVEGWERTPER